MFTIRQVLLLVAVTVAALGLTASTVSAAPIVLDDFTANTGSWNPVTAPGTLQSNATRTLILGAPGLQNGGDFVGIGSGVFSHQSADNSNFTTTLVYSFAPASLTTANSLHIDFLGIDGGSILTNQLAMLLEVVTSTGTLSKTVFFPEGNFFQQFLVGFDSLAGTGDLNSTIGVRLTFNSINDYGTDFRLTSQGGPLVINNFGVPEPATLATFGLIGLLGGYSARRRLLSPARI